METNIRIIQSIKSLNDKLEETKKYQEEINKVQDNLDKVSNNIKVETQNIRNIQEQIRNDINELEQKLQLNEGQLKEQNKIIDDKINNIKIKMPKDGKDGIDGKDGKDGKDGINGKDGKDGKDGLNGLNGKNGADGIGIYDIKTNEKWELIITLTNGKKYNCGIIKGAGGYNGTNGIDGVSVTNVEIINNHLIVTLSNGNTIDAGETSGGSVEEIDPIFTSSPAYNITNNDIKNWNNSGIEYIIGTQNEATNLWTGVSTDTNCSNGNVYTGKVIIYHLPQAGNSSSATLNLTLPDNSTTGAINIYRLATTTVTTNFASGCDILMVYDGTQWKINAYVDTNTNTIGYQLRTNSSIYKNGANTSIYRYQLLVETENGLEPFTSTSNSTKTTKTQLSPKYIPGGNIRYYGSTTAVESGNDLATGVLWQQYNVDLRYSFNITTSTFIAGKPVYMRMLKNNDGTLSPIYLLISKSHPLTQELPTEEDGAVYVLLGQAYSGYQIELTPLHTMYEYKNGKIREYIEESSSGGGGIQLFDVPIYWDEEEEKYTTDVTAEEIFSALEENKLIRIEDSGLYYICTTTNTDGDFCFISSNFFEVESVTMFNYSLIVEDDKVTVEVRQLVLQVV